MTSALPQEMQQHTYAIMDEVEGSHWWFVGRRAILESFLKGIIGNFRSEISNPRILDVGCGTGANLEMLSQFGSAEGVDVSDDALEFCRKFARERASPQRELDLILFLDAEPAQRAAREADVQAFCDSADRPRGFNE